MAPDPRMVLLCLAGVVLGPAGVLWSLVGLIEGLPFLRSRYGMPLEGRAARVAYAACAIIALAVTCLCWFAWPESAFY